MIGATLWLGVAACALVEPESTAAGADQAYELLVFSRTAGFRHASIEPGVEALARLAEEAGVLVHPTEDPAVFTDESLARFDAVVFLNTTGAVLDDGQRAAFQRYVRGGGGFVGVHAAADTEYDWPWYGQLVGAYFQSHPPVQPAVLMVVDADHPATGMLPERWERVDEWYNFREIPRHVQVLLRLDTDSYEGSGHPRDHPIAWYHGFEGGRAFYTGLGHTVESYTEDARFLRHLWGGIEYAMGVSGEVR